MGLSAASVHLARGALELDLTTAEASGFQGVGERRPRPLDGIAHEEGRKTADARRTARYGGGVHVHVHEPVEEFRREDSGHGLRAQAHFDVARLLGHRRLVARIYGRLRERRQAVEETNPLHRDLPAAAREFLVVLQESRDRRVCPRHAVEPAVQFGGTGLGERIHARLEVVVHGIEPRQVHGVGGPADHDGEHHRAPHRERALRAVEKAAQEARGRYAVSGPARFASHAFAPRLAPARCA